MLYVFHVDAGTMSTFDMNIALQSVTYLKQAIEKKMKIPANSLVLLVSGGEVLQSDHKVSSYSAGTDTNPIFMFSKPSIKDETTKQTPQYSVDYDCDLSPISDLSPSVEMRGADYRPAEMKPVPDMKPLVEACSALPPCHTTVAKCAQLAQQFGDIAVDFARSCQQLVHDQHLQHQGWAAVVANLEDIYNEFCERSINFKDSFKRHRQRKEMYHEQLSNLNNVLEELGKIPMLPALQLNAEAHRFDAFDEFDYGFNDFGAQYYQVSDDAQSEEKKELADFGVHALRVSHEDVFTEEKPWPEAKSSSDQECSAAEPDSAQLPAPELNESDEGVTFKAHSYDGKEEYTLLHWIMAKGNKASLQDILDYCQKGLALMETDPSKESELELYKMLEFANTHGLKQIKGIESRLYGLDELMAQVRKTEKDQIELENALVQNRDRVTAVTDPSVLPTLCSSHRLHLLAMLKKHESLMDLHRRIAKSKDELSVILKARLGAVLKIENLMSMQDAHQMLNFQCFNRLARYFDIVGQLHRAPELFAFAVHEVARRRLFSDAFLQWASELACHLLTIHNDESVRRQSFNAQFHGHFLGSLFPGTEDVPPTFASQAPHEFDSRLPKLTEEDVQFVSRSFPELTKDIDKCNMESVVEFFKSRMGPSAKFGKKEQGLTEMVQAGLEKGFDSETDTGEFEKLSRQSTTEKHRIDVSTTCSPETAAVSTITEVQRSKEPMLSAIPEHSPARDDFVHSEFYIDESFPSSLEWGRDERQENLETHKIRVEKLKDILNNLYHLCKMSVVFMKAELAQLRSDQISQRQFVKESCLQILQAWLTSNEDSALRFREETQKLTVDHEFELSDMKKILTGKDDTISGLHAERMKLQNEHETEKAKLLGFHQDTKDLLEKSCDDTKTLEKKILEMDTQKAKEIKDLQDKMHLEYKAEIESLRSRFRLVALTNMDRSPSESSLEKIERTDMIEITSHNSIVLQTKENMEVEKEEAVKAAVEKCEKEWQQKLQEEVDKVKSKYDSDKQVTLNEAVRRIIDEKDRQLDQSRERETNLVRECMKYKETIQQLTDPDTNDYETLLKSQVASLENEKALLVGKVEALERELEKRSASEEKEAEKKDGDTDGSSRSPPHKEAREEKQWSRSRPRSHTPLGVSPGTLSLASCLPGHTVLVLWDPAHHNYTVLQEAPVMYFVHSDCLPALELQIGARSEGDRRLYAVATVDSKEYCYAKKSGNRYHVPRGSRFYRVRVKPCRAPPPPPACCEHRHPRTHGSLHGGTLSVFCERRPIKKWLTYLHAPDIQKSQETSQSTSSATEKSERAAEVVTAALIDLSPPETRARRPRSELEESTSVCAEEAAGPPRGEGSEGEENMDSIEAADWHSRMQQSYRQGDMECGGVERATGDRLALELPLELSVSTQSIVAVSEPLAHAHAGQTLADLVESEIAEEATP